MPVILGGTTNWDAQALEARSQAAQETDPAMKAWLTQIAAEYERLARLLAGRQLSNPDSGITEP